MTAQEVTDYINKLSDKAGQEWQAEVSNHLRKVAQDNIPDFSEKLQYGKPHFFKNGKYAAVLGAAKGWVTFTIFNATDVKGPDGYFEEGPPERKTIKILKGQDVDYNLLGTLLKQAAQG
ncbi:MAG: DUF1801 domain-containing protein [Anaerolineae bacterium]|nr:DUF1801 domain-containing protein [Anaerolineae bacterium]